VSLCHYASVPGHGPQAAGGGGADSRGVLLLATLLGIVVDAAGGRLESLRKGRARVLESGHTLIIGEPHKD